MSHPIEEVIYGACDPILVSRSMLARGIDEYGQYTALRYHKYRQRIRVQGKWARRNRKRYARPCELATP